MAFEEGLGVPKPPEKLSESERVKRMHHQLGLMYARVFLTGDWAGYVPGDMQDRELAEDIATNIFEDRSVTDTGVLADGLTDFVRDAGKTIPDVLRPEDLMTTEGRHEFNRALFLKIAALTRDILKRSQKDVGTDDEIRAARAIEENTHFFRDMQYRNLKGMPAGALYAGEESVALDEQRATEGLGGIRDRLLEIVRSAPEAYGNPDRLL